MLLLTTDEMLTGYTPTILPALVMSQKSAHFSLYRAADKLYGFVFMGIEMIRECFWKISPFTGGQIKLAISSELFTTYSYLLSSKFFLRPLPQCVRQLALLVFRQRRILVRNTNRMIESAIRHTSVICSLR